jgi:CRISPR system Cascade subunit CasA
MTDSTYNLLTEPLIYAAPCGRKTLPGLLAALSRDEVECFPALRPHQGPAWHMFLVQLAALALHRAGVGEFSTEECDWANTLRGLTPDFADDEPWRHVVEDWSCSRLCPRAWRLAPSIRRSRAR